MVRTPADIRILFATRIVRLFAYGFFSVALALYLAEIGLSDREIGILLTATLLGDAVVSLWITSVADRIGRKKMLLLGSLLMALAGLVFSITRRKSILMLAAIFGVISPSGNEIGPFLSIEQAALSELISAEQRTSTFAWYNLVGSFATATGALCGGALAHALQQSGYTILASYRSTIIVYSVFGVALALLFLFLSAKAEPHEHRKPEGVKAILGLHRSRNVVLKLSSLFAMDAFAGGFVVQSILAYWFHLRFGADIQTLGRIFFAANLLAGISALSAVWLAKKVGLIRTMVYTHIPSNVLLIMVPLMPNMTIAIILLLARFSISQMDVPTRQAYTMSVVEPDERSAAAGVTNIARSVGASLSPSLTGILFSLGLLNAPLVIAGGLKIVYDLLLFRAFSKETSRL